MPRFIGLSLLFPLLLTVFLRPLSAHNGAVAIAVPVEGIVVDGDLSDWRADMTWQRPARRCPPDPACDALRGTPSRRGTACRTRRSWIYDAPDLIVDLPRLGRDQPIINIYTRQPETWSGWIADTGYSAISLLETRPGYRGQTGRGIQIGHSLSQVVDAYGAPAFVVAGRQGANHVYEHAGIAFRFDGESRVRGWMLFGTDE